MNPPTEQLIRDYLNRLSVAARSRLGVRERQELLDRTRARIEASVGGMSGATALKVRRVLADLGDPIALVEHEWARYAGRTDGVVPPGQPGPVSQPGPAGQPVPASHGVPAGYAMPASHGVPVPEPVPGGGAAGAAVRVPAARRGGSPGQPGRPDQPGHPGQPGSAGPGNTARPGGTAGLGSNGGRNGAGHPAGGPAGHTPVISLPPGQAVPGGGAAAAAIAASIPVRADTAVAASPDTRTGPSAAGGPRLAGRAGSSTSRAHRPARPPADTGTGTAARTDPASAENEPGDPAGTSQDHASAQSAPSPSAAVPQSAVARPPSAAAAPPSVPAQSAAVTQSGGWATPPVTPVPPARQASPATAGTRQTARPGPQSAPSAPSGPSAVAALPVPAGASEPGEVPRPGAGGPSSGSSPSGGSGSGSSSTGSGSAATGSAQDAGAPKAPLPREIPGPERIGDAVPGQDAGPPGEGDERAAPGSTVAVPETGTATFDAVPADDVIYEAELVYRPADLVRQARDVAHRSLAASTKILARQAWRVGASLLALAMRDKLETLAILLLGVGGAVYPPVWIIGAILVLISRNWDMSDKLLGLLLPVLLVVFGAVLVVTLGGVRTSMTQYGLEGWLAAGRLARVGAVIGAGYLLRRVYRPRAPKPPPWSRPPGSR